MLAIELIHPLKQQAIQSWKFDLAQKSISIGRSRTNDIPLASAVVSRNHAVLHREALGWRLELLGTNGCFIDEKLTTQAYLRDGQIFRIARTGPYLRVVLRAEAAEVPLLRQRQQQRRPLRSEDAFSARETFVG